MKCRWRYQKNFAKNSCAQIIMEAINTTLNNAMQALNDPRAARLPPRDGSRRTFPIGLYAEFDPDPREGVDVRDPILAAARPLQSPCQEEVPGSRLRRVLDACRVSSAKENGSDPFNRSRPVDGPAPR